MNIVRLPPQPQAVKLARLGPFAGEGFGDDRPAQPHAGEAGLLGETVDLDGAGLGPFDLIDRTRQARVADKGGIGGVENDDRLVRKGVIHKKLELRAGGDGARGIIRTANVDEVGLALGRLGEETVGLVAGHIDQPLILPASVAAGAPGDDVGIDVNRIGGVLNGDDVIEPKDGLDISRVGLGAVADEELIGLERDAVARVTSRQSFAKGLVALLIAVTGIGLDPLRASLRHHAARQ